MDLAHNLQDVSKLIRTGHRFNSVAFCMARIMAREPISEELRFEMEWCASLLDNMNIHSSYNYDPQIKVMATLLAPRFYEAVFKRKNFLSLGFTEALYDTLKQGSRGTRLTETELNDAYDIFEEMAYGLFRLVQQQGQI